MTALHTNGAVGELTADQALTKLLSGTGLVYRYIDDNTISIMPANGAAAAPPDRLELDEAMPSCLARFSRELNRKRPSQPEPDPISLTAAWPDQPAGAYLGRM